MSGILKRILITDCSNNKASHKGGSWMGSQSGSKSESVIVVKLMYCTVAC